MQTGRWYLEIAIRALDDDQIVVRNDEGILPARAPGKVRAGRKVKCVSAAIRSRRCRISRPPTITVSKSMVGIRMGCLAFSHPRLGNDLLAIPAPAIEEATQQSLHKLVTGRLSDLWLFENRGSSSDFMA